jgi:hypothetical protein
LGPFWLREGAQEEGGCIPRVPVLFIIDLEVVVKKPVKGGDVEVGTM